MKLLLISLVVLKYGVFPSLVGDLVGGRVGNSVVSGVGNIVKSILSTFSRESATASFSLLYVG